MRAPHDLSRVNDPLASDDWTEDAARQWGRLQVFPSFSAQGCEAGSYQTVRFEFVVGTLGLDENGGLRLSFRFVSDMGRPQTSDPTADDYVTARCSGQADIALTFEAKGNVRPFQPTLRLDVRNGSLTTGDKIEIVLGDTSGGSRGWRQQTFVEEPFPVRVAVDPLGTHDYRELPDAVGWKILPGPLHRYVINSPSAVLAGEEFQIRLKGEDVWGNPLRALAGEAPRLRLRRVGHDLDPVATESWATAAATHTRGVWSLPVKIRDVGDFSFAAEGDIPSISNPFAVRANEAELPTPGHHWCDLHGQSGETVGVGTVREYFDFARHFGFLDGSAHQGNDFQIGPDTWNEIKAATDAAYEAGAFVTLHGYEWSGTTSMGGDHNVLFNEPDPPIYRSTGWLVGNPYEETAPLSALYRALSGHEAMTIAHVGGRPAALEESDPALEHLMELHSAWGTFEWVYQEAFARGFKVGFVCNSDGHKCRPGASYPGGGIFGTLGGLTCVLSETRDRDGFWQALRERRTYGTTGQRIVIEADMNGLPIGSEVRAEHATVKARVIGTDRIARIDLFRGSEVVQTYRPPPVGDATSLLLRFGGSRVKGRARMVRWSGRLALKGNAAASAVVHGLHSPAYGISSLSEREVEFASVTTGNLVNLLVNLRDGPTGTMRFETGVVDLEVDLATLSREPRTLFQAPLDQLVEASLCDPAELPHVAGVSFDVAVEHNDEQPYFLRVTQLDEAKAWTSPFYLARNRGQLNR